MTADPHTAIARRLAESFAPELGAKLPTLVERLLDGEPADETPMRSGGSLTLLGYAGYLVALSALALDVYRRLTLEREVQALQSRTSLLEDVLNELRSHAPHERRLTGPLREQMVKAAAHITMAAASPVTGRAGPLLSHDVILELHRATLSARLLDREALLVGIDTTFAARLPSAPSHAEQILRDLGALNDVGALDDGTVPLFIWLANAITLAGSRREARIFAQARAWIEE